MQQRLLEYRLQLLKRQGHIVPDMELLKTARDAAVYITEDDPNLCKNENLPLKNLVLKKFENHGGKSILN